MSFFGNDAINRVNLHAGVMSLAQSAGGVFFLVFLLRAGVSVPLTLAAEAAVFAARFALRPALLPLAKRFGLKPLMIAGTLALAAQYPLLPLVHGPGAALAAVIAASAVGELIYYLAGNAYVSVIGDAEHRGHQLAAREALVAAVGAAGPLAGAWALVAIGPGPTFAAVGLVQVLAAAPLLGLPNVPVRAHAPGAYRAARPAVLLMAFDGWFDACYIYVWQIALFVSLSQSFASYGGAMALAGLAGGAFALWLGRHVDGGGGRRAVMVTYGMAAAGTALRAASLTTPWLAVAAGAFGALLSPLIGPTLGTPTSNWAKASPCPLRFRIGTEAGWDAGAAAACLAAAGLSVAGASLALPLLIALPAIAGSALVLWRHYGAPSALAGARP